VDVGVLVLLGAVTVNCPESNSAGPEPVVRTMMDEGPVVALLGIVTGMLNVPVLLVVPVPITELVDPCWKRISIERLTGQGKALITLTCVPGGPLLGWGTKASAGRGVDRKERSTARHPRPATSRSRFPGTPRAPGMRGLPRRGWATQKAGSFNDINER
jgi:hypothetical protein